MVTVRDILDTGKILVIAIDPGTKHLAFTINLVAPQSSEQDNFSLLLRLKKYTKTYIFDVKLLYTTLANVTSCSDIYKFFATYKPLFLELLRRHNGSEIILPILVIERFVYYGRKSIRFLEQFNKIIGCLQYGGLAFFDYVAEKYKPILEPVLLEATYKQWFSELYQQVQRQNFPDIAAYLQKRGVKKQKKDEVLFKTLYGSPNSTDFYDSFKPLGDHIFDTFLLTAYGLYKTI